MSQEDSETSWSQLFLRLSVGVAAALGGLVAFSSVFDWSSQTPVALADVGAAATQWHHLPEHGLHDPVLEVFARLRDGSAHPAHAKGRYLREQPKKEQLLRAIEIDSLRVVRRTPSWMRGRADLVDPRGKKTGRVSFRLVKVDGHWAIEDVRRLPELANRPAPRSSKP